MKYIMSVEELKERLQGHDNKPVLVDVRYDLMDEDAGKQAYEAGHLPGAVFLDIKKDLSGEAKTHGGNHPLPNFLTYKETLERNGIGNETTVVIYSHISDLFAARAWWLLHYVGHEKVYVLDGGIKAWQEAGYGLTTEVVQPVRQSFTVQKRDDRLVSMEDVRDRPKEQILIDARDRERYLGGNNPLQAKTGHIPGAKNFFWKDVIADDGSFRPREELERYYESLPKSGEVILSCGSGISACVHLLLLKELAHTDLLFYPGSFSDWISYEENETETKES